VTQFATNQIAEMARDTTLDAFMTVGPLDSKITKDAIAATAASRGEPKFLRSRFRKRSRKSILSTNPKNSRQHLQLFAGTADDKVDTVSVNHLIIAPKSLSDTVVGAFAGS